MSCSRISIVDFEHEFVCLVFISLVSILRRLNLEFNRKNGANLK